MYSSTVYLYMNLESIYSAMSVCVSHVYDFSWNDAMKIENDYGSKKGLGPFRVRKGGLEDMIFHD